MTMTLPLPDIDTVVQLIALGGWFVCLILLLQIRSACLSLSRQATTVQRTSRLARYRQWLNDSRLRSYQQAQPGPGGTEPLLVQDGVIDVEAYLRESRKGNES